MLNNSLHGKYKHKCKYIFVTKTLFEKKKEKNSKIMTQNKKIYIRSAFSPIFTPEAFYVRTKFQWMVQGLESKCIISYFQFLFV